MDLYHIPGDTGKPFRRKVVQSLLKGNYVDGATDYCMLVPYADTMGLSESERVWLAYLYGLSYSCTTAIRLFQVVSNPLHIDIVSLKKFWRSEKDTLWFNPDRRYVKNNDQVIPSMLCISQIADECDGLDRWVVASSANGQDFNNLYRSVIKQWDFFGPMGAYLFFDALYGLCPSLYVDPDHLDWKHSGKTVVEGMAHMMYQDELIETREFPLKAYNAAVNRLQKSSGQPKVIIESTLCAFRKLFKGTRYMGYYADRMLEECVYVDSLNAVDVIDVWELRKRSIPKPLRGEDNGWSGIRKERLKNWLERGEL